VFSYREKELITMYGTTIPAAPDSSGAAVTPTP
jgi:hypothetical protein